MEILQIIVFLRFIWNFRVIIGLEEIANCTFNFFLLLMLCIYVLLFFSPSGPDSIHNSNVHIWKCSSVNTAFVTKVQGLYSGVICFSEERRSLLPTLEQRCIVKQLYGHVYTCIKYVYMMFSFPVFSSSCWSSLIWWHW